LPVKLPLLGRIAKKLNLEHKHKLKEGDLILKMEFCEYEAYLVNWQICRNVARTLVCICARSDDICFSNKIDNNMIMAVKIEEELTHLNLSGSDDECGLCVPP